MVVGCWLRMRPMTLFEQGHSSGAMSLGALMSGDGPSAARCGLDLLAYTERIVIGGWPQLLGVDSGTAIQFVLDYVDTIVEHDIGYLFESLATRDLRVYAEAQGDHVFHYREHSGDLEVDLVVEQTGGNWAGFEVKLGGDLIDEAATALTRLANTRIARPPSALAVITGTEFGYRRPDGVWVIPLGCLGP
jgi:hypothetical protein